MVRILHLNTNHSGPSQDNFLHLMEEMDAGLATIAEPYRIPKGNSKWVYSSEDSPKAAILWRRCKGLHLPMQEVDRGPGFVLVRWNGLLVASCYNSRNVSIREFNAYLDALHLAIVRHVNTPLLILGDFNAHHSEWNPGREDTRGKLLKGWLDNLGLFVLNTDYVATCRRPQGNSVVDLCIGNSLTLDKIYRLEVRSEIPTVSDHCIICVDLLSGNARLKHLELQQKFPRWNYKKLDVDLLGAGVIFKTWTTERLVDLSATDSASWLNKALVEVSNISMPKSGKRGLRNSAYWWNEEVADLRAILISKRRILIRTRKREKSEESVLTNAHYRAYRRALRDYRQAIKRAKNKSWKQLLDTLDKDPWGLPYKLVTSKLRYSSHPVSETLPKDTVEAIVDGLFPTDREELEGTRELGGRIEWTDEYSVTNAEVRDAIKRFHGDRKAPGPDGILGGIIAGSGNQWLEIWALCFSRCLRDGCFPSSWKRAKLVLLKKKEGNIADPKIYRPICLLNEAGKLLEKVIANRLNEHIAESGCLSDDQFGFRRGRSTMDAILRLKNWVEEYSQRGKRVVAIGLDISNAFNSLPWRVIRQAMLNMDFPSYLIGIVSSYLRDRWLTYVDCAGEVVERPVSRGVPQGSVLGPILWNIGFNDVLETELPDGCRVICYADDTVILASGTDRAWASYAASVAAFRIVSAIERLGLCVAPQKSEAMIFGIERYRVDRVPESLVVKGHNVKLATRMKYLGVILDCKWNFQDHFEMAESKVEKIVGHLNRIMPNNKGPSELKRRLYRNVVISVLTYGAPIWADALEKDRKNKHRVEGTLRKIAQRVCRAYRTVSYIAALVMSGTLPLEITARKLSNVFHRLRSAQNGGEDVTPRMRAIIKQQEETRALERWRNRLETLGPEDPGRRIREAIVPSLKQWIDRQHGMLTYHVTQILSGHGCMNAFLHRIRKAESPICAHCNESTDDAQHTLQFCPEWNTQRAALRAVIGHDLQLPNLIAQILICRENWVAFSLFCRDVLTRKEVAERSRQAMARAVGPGHLDSDISEVELI